MKPYKPILKPFSRNLRSNLTDAEQLLWSKLRRKQILGLQFYRQKPVSGFIVDFYCAAANLVIELDGSQHVESEHQIKDIQRDQKLNTLGLQVLRFNNHQVLTEQDAVMDVVFEVVKKKIPPNPPFTKGGVRCYLVTLFHAQSLAKHCTFTVIVFWCFNRQICQLGFIFFNLFHLTAQ